MRHSQPVKRKLESYCRGGPFPLNTQCRTEISENISDKLLIESLCPAPHCFRVKQDTHVTEARQLVH